MHSLAEVSGVDVKRMGPSQLRINSLCRLLQYRTSIESTICVVLAAPLPSLTITLIYFNKLKGSLYLKEKLFFEIRPSSSAGQKMILKLYFLNACRTTLQDSHSMCDNKISALNSEL